METAKNPLVRWALVSAGLLFTGLGLIGIFVPLLPTTPFLLLAAACFIRSSGRLYRWLTTNSLFGRYLTNYMEGRGIPIGVKIFTIVLLWASILVSAIFFADSTAVRLLLLFIAVCVTIHLLCLKTARGMDDELQLSVNTDRGSSHVPGRGPGGYRARTGRKRGA